MRGAAVPAAPAGHRAVDPVRRVRRLVPHRLPARRPQEAPEGPQRRLPLRLPLTRLRRVCAFLLLNVKFLRWKGASPVGPCDFSTPIFPRPPHRLRPLSVSRRNRNETSPGGISLRLRLPEEVRSERESVTGLRSDSQVLHEHNRSVDILLLSTFLII